MKDIESVMLEVKKSRQIELTWSATFLVTKLMTITVLAASIAFFVNLTNLSGTAGFVLVFIIVLNAYAGLNFYFTSKASIKGKTVTIKKIFRQEIGFPIEAIKRIRSFALKSTNYTLIKYDWNGKSDWALIVNSNSWIFGRELPASDILRAAKKINW